MNWIPWILSGFGVLLALISLLRTFLVAGRDRSEHFTKDLMNIQERTGLLEMKIGVFWRLIEEHLSSFLKKPTHHEMDTLLDKLKAHTLTLEESKRLRGWLQRVYLDDEATHAQQRLTAILVMAALESLIHELERSAPSSP